jgi:hypothetical protein
VPQGWRIERLGGPLAWAIKEECPGPGEWQDREYDLWITRDLELLIITHDNRDVGVGPLFENAVVLHVRTLRCWATLPSAVRHVMSRFKPNEWGCT